MTPYREELEFAKRLAQLCRTGIVQAYTHGVTSETKPDGTPVTRVDKELSEFVRRELERHRPDEPLISEEDELHHWGEGRRDKTARRWLCDPVDGTWLLAGGVPTSMFSLCLLEYGEPVAAVLLDPYTNTTYSAAKDSVATRNVNDRAVTTLRVNRATTIAGSCFALPGSNERYSYVNAVGLFRDVVGQGGEMVTHGSVIYDAVQVAYGFAAGAVYPYGSPWDMAGIKVVVEAAGGRVTNLHGRPQRYDQPVRGAVVSNGCVHDELVALVARNLK